VVLERKIFYKIKNSIFRGLPLKDYIEEQRKAAELRPFLMNILLCCVQKSSRMNLMGKEMIIEKEYRLTPYETKEIYMDAKKGTVIRSL
jgi:hypothetical protein